MVHRRWMVVMGLTAGLGLLGEAASAQGQDQRLQIVRKQAQRIAAKVERMPPRQAARLSSGALMLKALNDRWSEFERMAAAVGAGRSNGSNRPNVPTPKYVSALLAPGRASDPKADVTFSNMLGFTQSETSTAWCGTRVVVSFNDSGSFPESFFTGPGGGSFNGYAVSTNTGVRFTDYGFLNPSSNVDFFLSGDPVVACTSASVFYYASLLEDYGPNESAISVSKSSDGGISWGDPVKTASKSLSTHFLDKEWMAVDPSNPNNIFVTYTDFDSSFPNSCSSTISVFRIGIELVKSTDGGATWSAPLVIDQACDPDGNQGSQVAVDNAGAVYVAWLHFPGALPTNQQRVVRSTDGGATFSPIVDNANLVVELTGGIALGGRQTLQGQIRTNDFPSLAIDRTTGPRQGFVYLAWQDGGRVQVTDPLSGSGEYHYADIKLSVSSDGGATWSVPVLVNNTVEPLALPYFGTDQFFPGVAVDRTGAIGVCFYDRRRDPANFLIDRECAKSLNGGATFTNVKKTIANFPSTSSQDFVIATGYQGDYDTLVGDWLKVFSGFRGAYNDHALGNQDVKVHSH